MILEHTVGLFTNPDQEWTSIRSRRASAPGLFAKHTLLLAMIPALAAFYGTTRVGWTLGSDSPVMLTQTSALNLCVLFYFAMLAGVFILGKFIDFMAVTYGVSGSTSRGVELAAYAATPLFLAGASVIYPDVWLNLFVGLIGASYAVYLLYQGLPILMNIPKERGFLFATSVLTVGLVMFVAMMAITVVIWSVGIGPVYTS